ncbi:hypothetical protein WJX81_002128 [Elliptochloris bilobata]|uniref:Ubiquitin-like domain-containing protein n=1 Tax=Elliptochloris bilobata TaxID=381761 RepID=A0AAW1SG28_9CHLO
MVSITVHIMGGARKLSLEVAEDISVAELRGIVARGTGCPAKRLKLIRAAHSLRDEDGAAGLPEGASLLAVVVPLPPSQAAQAQADPRPSEEADVDAARFQLPADASLLTRRAATFCQQRLRLPELLMVVLFSVRPWVWAALGAWLACAPLAHRLEVGPLYVLASAAALIFLNLGTRKAGEASAYSIFNAGFRELPGQLNAAAMDEQLRRGQL